MIINVTGGPDLSLIEVSEASAIIQEAAHEDANIIFGAVVDPKLEGKVKITVIATGFDRPAAAQTPPPSAAQTPVDLQSYAAWKQEARRTRSPVGGGSRMTFIAAAGPRPAADAAPPASRIDTVRPGAEFEPVSPLDVPAFLRRQNES